MTDDVPRNDGPTPAVTDNAAPTTDASARPKPRSGFGWKAVAVGAACLVLGAGAGAFAMKNRGFERQALLPPVAISAMTDGSLVAVKGKVAEQFGNKFIITDGAARALVDTGPSGDGAKLVKDGEEVTVQGRYNNGFLRAAMLIHADGKVDELRPAHGPHGPGKGRGGPHVRPDDRAPPPPPGNSAPAPTQQQPT